MDGSGGGGAGSTIIDQIESEQTQSGRRSVGRSGASGVEG